ncbi:MAG: hypothetical protein LBM96_06960, partial [Methanobrevibacter sp.]|nr:hypothetical protein [Candidatus Methanoflexus mossambicus]
MRKILALLLILGLAFFFFYPKKETKKTKAIEVETIGDAIINEFYIYGESLNIKGNVTLLDSENIESMQLIIGDKNIELNYSQEEDSFN